MLYTVLRTVLYAVLNTLLCTVLYAVLNTSHYTVLFVCSAPFDGFMTSPLFSNVVLDVHFYNVFEPALTDSTYEQNINYVNTVVSVDPHQPR